MFSKLMFVLVTLGSALHAVASPVASPWNQTGIQPFAESHRVEIVNRCGRGQGRFLYRDNGNPQGPTTINGPLYGGVAWMDGYADCGASGVNCGVVEFTLINPGTDGANTFNSADYSLLNSGNHQFKYAMNFYFTGGCTAGAPGQCTSTSNCPGAYTGGNSASGRPVTCSGANTGVSQVCDI